MAEEWGHVLAISHKHNKKTYLHVKWLAQNSNWMLAEEHKPPKMARILWHDWVNKRKEEREKGNQDQTGTPERELWRRKGTHTLSPSKSPNEGKINRVGGISRCQEKCLRRAPWPRSSRANPAQPREVHHHCSAVLLFLPTLGMSSFAQETPCCLK